MAIRPLKLTRDQLRNFIGDDPQAIRQFEKLFAAVDDMDGDSAALIASELANARSQQALDQLTAIASALEIIASQPAPADVSGLISRLDALEAEPSIQHHAKTFCYGSFYSAVDQTAAVINTAYVISMASTYIANGTRLSSNRVYVDRAGIFRLGYTAQFLNTSGGAHTTWIWPRVNGTDIASSTLVAKLVGNNAESTITGGFVLKLNAGDYIEIVWEVSDTALSLYADAASAVHPAVPSIIVTITNDI